MNRLIHRLSSPSRILIVLGILMVVITIYGTLSNPEFWFTADQRGDRLMRQEQYEGAAETYRDPIRAGTARFRDGQFEEAAAEFQKSSHPEALYNRGNALVMLGKYQDAVTVYDSALAARPGWPEAVTNREVAALRAEKLKKEGGDMTGGMLGADDFVFTKGQKNNEQAGEETTDGGEELSDAALQAMWLRRVQTKPADFLRSKFAFQAQQEAQP